MNRNTQQHTRIDRYALGGPRWWWTPATGGLVVTTALAAILTSAAPGNAIPIEVDRYAGSGMVVPVAEPPDLPVGWRQCFMWQSRWNTVLDGPQPLCRQGFEGDEGGDGHEGQAQSTASGSAHAKAEAVGHWTGQSLRHSAKWVPLP